MVWIAAFGVLLQVLGLAVATCGVAATYQEAVDRRLWPDVRSGFISWVRHLLGRDRAVGQTVHVGGVANISVVGNARLSSRRPEPEDDSPLEEQVAYLLSAVVDIDRTVEADRKAITSQVQAVEERLGTRVDHVSAQVADAHQQLRSVRSALFGADGAGLRRAAVGLVITMIGVGFTVAGLPW